MWVWVGGDGRSDGRDRWEEGRVRVVVSFGRNSVFVIALTWNWSELVQRWYKVTYAWHGQPG